MSTTSNANKKNLSRHGRIVAVAGAVWRATAVLSKRWQSAAPPVLKTAPGSRVEKRAFAKNGG
ncbi:hypothetical protein KTQ42_15035|uniref:hypothetical protein n=1 Tax=Noviherbaspirillum sp. L7-7A TaxID=2850560 RepID=UPI001C2C2525|nr:hypothetical protein [Noviherbaspirillum sp. L7-7A]MBV0880616.1 hypothetical protein [Noviherbaspirillum sp. L7-7A]